MTELFNSHIYSSFFCVPSLFFQGKIELQKSNFCFKSNNELQHYSSYSCFFSLFCSLFSLYLFDVAFYSCKITFKLHFHWKKKSKMKQDWHIYFNWNIGITSVFDSLPKYSNLLSDIFRFFWLTFLVLFFLDNSTVFKPLTVQVFKVKLFFFSLLSFLCFNLIAYCFNICYQLVNFKLLTTVIMIDLN